MLAWNYLLQSSLFALPIKPCSTSPSRYDFLASVFINVEADMRDEFLHKPGGWEGYRPMTVTKKEAESADVTSFTLLPPGGEPLIDFVPGNIFLPIYDR